MKLLIRWTLALAGVVAVVAGLSAQTSGGRVGPAGFGKVGPKIQFNTETDEAGTNFSGDLIRYTFAVTNTGDETLIISNVIPTCGCTTIGDANSGAPWTDGIPPGRTTFIPIQVNTLNYRGPINKTISVISNDRSRPDVKLQVNAFISVPIEIMPQPAVYFTLMPGATNESAQTLKIVNRMEAPLELSGARTTTNAFAAVLKTNVPGQEFELTVTAASQARLPASLSMTMINGDISLQCSLTNRNPLVIPVYETIPAEIMIYPPNLQLPAGPLAQPSTSRVTIRDNVGSLILADPEVNVPGLVPSLIVMQTNRTYVLTATFPEGFSAMPGQNIIVTVKTDNPRFPTISVPVVTVAPVALPTRQPFTASPVLAGRLAPAGAPVVGTPSGGAMPSTNPAPAANASPR